MRNEDFKEKTVWDPVINFYCDQPQQKQEKRNKSTHFQANQQIQSERRVKARKRHIQRQESQQHQDEMQ